MLAHLAKEQEDGARVQGNEEGHVLFGQDPRDGVIANLEVGDRFDEPGSGELPRFCVATPTLLR